MISINIGDVIHPKQTPSPGAQNDGTARTCQWHFKAAKDGCDYWYQEVKTTSGRAGQEKRVELYLVKDEKATWPYEVSKAWCIDLGISVQLHDIQIEINGMDGFVQMFPR